MTAVALVFGAVILLIWTLVDSYSGRDHAPFKRRPRRAHAGDGDAGWSGFGGDAAGSDCGPGDSGGSCGDGGGD